MLIGLPASVCAQQPSILSLYMANRYVVNPAYAGFDGSISATAAYRTHWLGLERNPVNQLINAHMPLYIAQGGIGISFENEFLGAERNLRFSASYNYVREISIGLLSAGIRVGVHQKGIDGSLLRTPGGIYEGSGLDHRDPILPLGLSKGLSPYAGIGFYFIHDYFEGGVAIDNINSPQIKISTDDELTIKLPTYFNVYGEYHGTINEEVSWYPSFFFLSDFTQSHLGLSVLATYRDVYYGGLGYRGIQSTDLKSLNILLGIQLSDQWRLYYAYDIPLNGGVVQNRGGHEIVFNYNLGKPVGIGLPPKVIYNPRY